jgi:hypothetical protein
VVVRRQSQKRKHYKNSIKSIEKMWFGNFNHRYNVSPVHLHALLGVGNFAKVVRMCADCL